MKKPLFKCLFCLETHDGFNKVEHIIPESLGNDDAILERGFICDKCNQYFGTKIESRVLNAPPFNVERTAAAVKTKKGKLSKFEVGKDLTFYSTGVNDHLVFIGMPGGPVDELIKNGRLIVQHTKENDFLTLRLLLKIGLELLLTSKEKCDPYEKCFDATRRYSRFADPGTAWDLGYAIYPFRKDLFISQREDEIGPLVTHQIYQFEMGQMLSGDIILNFVYRTHIFACNLSSPSLEEYVSGFNTLNSPVKMRIIKTKA